MEIVKTAILVIILGIVIGATSLIGSYAVLRNTYTRQDLDGYAVKISNELVKIKEVLLKCKIDPKTLECEKPIEKEK